MTGNRPLVVLAAGGTGGHVFPAEALAGELGRRGFRLALVTDRRGGVYGGVLGDTETHRIRAGGLAGKSLVARLRSVPELAVGVWQARGLLKRLAPAAVVGFGGYAAAPTMMAATLAGLATMIHEQNAVLGRANRFLAPRVNRIAVCFEKPDGVPSGGSARISVTGMPVRDSFVAAREKRYPNLDENSGLEILVIGGSQGARILSDVVPDAIGMLPEHLVSRIRVTQQCRPEDLERVRERYAALGVTAELSDFFADVPERLVAAHLLVGRAGASTVAELTAVGRPGILVPYPYAVDDHQSKNAHALDEAGAGWMMPQPAFTPEALAERLRSLFELPATLQKAAENSRNAGRPDAAARLADLVGELTSSNGAGGGASSMGRVAA